MDEQRNAESRIALIGLTVLVVATLILFAFVFLDAGDLFTETPSSETTETEQTDTSTEDTSAIAEEIASARTEMNAYQTQLDSPYLLFVNEQNPIPAGYTVDLIPLTHSDGSLKLDKAAASAMNALLAEAETAGFSVSVRVAYRTEAEQQQVYDGAVSGYMKAGYSVEEARSKAAKEVGSVNCSEHQLGLAVDFDPKDLALTGSAGQTFEEYLNANAHRYGFILSFPAGAEDQTGRNANTDHYRYVGVEIATAMVERRYSLAEYREHLEDRIEYCRQKIDALQKR